jgi:uncharacterized protein YdhG (YjbR/CyaY superfamily)
MNRRSAGISGVDEYIAAFPPRVRTILRKIRATVAATAPDASQKISYRMPAFAQDGILIKFPMDEPVPYHLIRRIVALRLRQNAAKAATRRKN